jgi:hypothetical protein
MKHRENNKPHSRNQEKFSEKAGSSEREKLTKQTLDEQFINICSFYLETSAAVCDKPLFDKKKQLCRSHNKQV